MAIKPIRNIEKVIPLCNANDENNDDFSKIKKIDTILEALKLKDKLNERMGDIYEFIKKQKYLFMNGFHNRKIILMFYDEVIDYFKEKTNNKNCMIIEKKIIYVSKKK